MTLRILGVFVWTTYGFMAARCVYSLCQSDAETVRKWHERTTDDVQTARIGALIMLAALAAGFYLFMVQR